MPDETKSTIHVDVLLFSLLRDRLGWQRCSLALAAPASGVDLLDELQRRHTEISDHRQTIRLAVNQEFASDDTVLSDGDEVALITPVSGG